MVASDLPQEILIDIFSRLPAKSVGQCRCLSKAWRHTLSSPHFIKSHLNRKTHQQSLLIYDVSHSFHFIATFNDGAVSRELWLPSDCTNYTEIVGSCDGLVLLVNRYNDKFLVNPVTLEKVTIPNSPLALQGDEGVTASMHGFGYDSSADDYKIVTLSYYKVDVEDEDDVEDEEDLDCEETFVDVYSMKRGVWERVESSPYNHAIPEPYSGAFLNGAIHWLARSRESSYRSVLVAFSLFDEVFTEIPTPNDIQMGDFQFCQVVVLGGCLRIIDVRYGYRTYVWIMKEYGLVESWTKLSIGICDEWGIGKPLCFVGDQEIVSAVYGRPLRVYNPKERTFRDLIFDGLLATIEDGVIFVPSLVSPDYEASLLDYDRLEASANLALALTIQSVAMQRLEDYRMAVSALERSVEKSKSGEDKAELESELRKKSAELSNLTRNQKEFQACIQRFSKMLRETFVSTDRGKALINEMCRQSMEGYKASSEFRADFFGNVVRMCRRHLRESGQFNEDIVMSVGPGVPDSC